MSTKPAKSMPPTAKPLQDRSRAALAFVDAGKPKRPASEQVSGNGKKSTYAPEGHRRLTINVPEEWHKELRKEAFDRDCTVTEVALERLFPGRVESK